MIYPGAISFDQPVDPIDSFKDLDYPYKTREWEGPDGSILAFGSGGRGETPIVCLHGLGSYGPSWFPLVEHLSKSFHFQMPDWPEHGHSPLADFKISMNSYVRLIKSFVESQTRKCPLIIGQGMGGQIAIQFALEYPEMLRGLILLAPWGLECFTEGEKQLLLEAYDPTRMRMSGVAEIQRSFNSHFYNTPKVAYVLLRHRYQMRYAREFPDFCQMMPRCVRAMLDAPVHDRLSGLKKPVYCLFGQGDQILPSIWLHGGSVNALIRRTLDGYNHIRSEEIERAGHFLQFERPELIAKNIVEWYESVDI